MSRVFLRRGQLVTTKVAPGWKGKIERVIVPANGERVIEIIGTLVAGGKVINQRLYVGASQVEVMGAVA